MNGVHAVDAGYDGVPLTVYLVEADGLTLIDAGVATTPGRHVLPALRALGAAPQDVAWLLNTHAHHDHVGGNGAMRAAHPDLRIAVHRADAAWAESRLRYTLGLYRASFPGVWDPPAELERRISELWHPDSAVDRRLEDGERVELGGQRTLESILAPAHSPGHLLFHDARAEVLFAGDAIQGWGIPRHGRPWLFPLYADLPAYRRSLTRIRALGARHVCTAHSGVLSAAGAERALTEAEEAVAEIDEVLRALLRERRRVTLLDAADALMARWPEHDRGLQVYATASAHLDELVSEGAARPHVDEGTKAWTAE